MLMVRFMGLRMHSELADKKGAETLGIIILVDYFILAVNLHASIVHVGSNERDGTSHM